LQTQGENLAKQVDWGTANGWRMPVSAVLRANSLQWKNTPTVGSNANMPVLVRDMKSYQALPDGTWVTDPKENVAKKGEMKTP